MVKKTQPPKDYYEILEVQADAGEEELRKAYRRLALQWHPDRNPGVPEATERFQEISEAYAALADPVKRREYDDLRRTRAYGEFAYSREDLFRDMFASPRAAAVFEELAREFERMGMRVDRHYFEQTLFGGRMFFAGGVFVISPLTPLLAIGRAARAILRGGAAAVEAAGKQAPAIPGVSGLLSGFGRAGRWLLGIPPETVPGPPSAMEQDVAEVVELSQSESEQGVQKRVSLRHRNRTEDLLVRIPPGVRDGMRLRLKGKGHQSPAGPAGDLYLTVKIRT